MDIRGRFRTTLGPVRLAELTAAVRYFRAAPEQHILRAAVAASLLNTA
ncbi:MAG: hypothetical protein VX378_02815 [Pseudomonadota bacterium]|nr:hypothetical protein [Pseudomonadota bacterium]MEE3070007.1 hypothetical protein [Pseudomonadota bacterium]